MEGRTKQELRAIRELTGITQSALAEMLGVQVRSVKRWESTEAPQQAPRDAWDILDEAWDAQQEGLHVATETARELMESYGDMGAVVLPYWEGQQEYETYSTDSMMGTAGSWREANANIRALATILVHEGIIVNFMSGRDWAETYRNR